MPDLSEKARRRLASLHFEPSQGTSIDYPRRPRDLGSWPIGVLPFRTTNVRYLMALSTLAKILNVVFLVSKWLLVKVFPVRIAAQAGLRGPLLALPPKTLLGSTTHS
jgi:hypothetical protein